MDVKDYIEGLKKLKPSEELLLKSGFTSIPTAIIKKYVLDKRENKNEDFKEMNGAIFALFNEYDTQYLRFADFSFYSTIKHSDDLFIFAGSSYSELAFKTADSEVVEYDREEWSVLNYCAKNTEAFLETLLVVFEMYALRFQNLISTKDSQINGKYLERCSQISGGNKYRRFYKEIIG